MSAPLDGEWRATEALVGQLDRLQEPHATKKRNTILALVEARIAGRSEETIWGRPDTCNRSTYHTKWKNDPVFKDVLSQATKIARGYQDTRAARALQTAAERLALASPVAVARLIGLLDSPDDAAKHRAAVAILDRAGLETASKTTTVSAGATLDEWRADAERRRATVDAMLAEMDEDEDDAGADAGNETPEEAAADATSTRAD